MRVQVLAVGFIGGMLLAGSVVAHDGATGVVKERMDMMENLKSVMKTVAPMVKGQKPIDADVVAAQAKVIQANSGAALESKFPKDSIHGPSEALPAIWEEWDKFKNLNDQLAELGKKLEANAADEAAMKMTFKDIAATCGACHKQFKDD